MGGRLTSSPQPHPVVSMGPRGQMASPAAWPAGLSLIQMSCEQVEWAAAGVGAVKQSGDPRTIGATCHGGNSRLSHNGPPGDSSRANCCHRHGLAEANCSEAVFSYEAANRQGSRAVT